MTTALFVRAGLAAALSSIALGACAQTPKPAAQAAAPAHDMAGHAALNPAPAAAPSGAAEARIIGRSGAEIGRAYFAEGPKGVLIRLEFKEQALTPGWHGAHLHQVGRCDDFAAGFLASGAHLGKADGVMHGLLNPQGPEAGDLPSIFAPAVGKFGAEMFSTFVSLGGAPGRAALFDADGAALILHETLDDQKSQPIGGAGGRVACAALPAPRPIPRAP